MNLLQLTVDTSISANWFIAIVLMVVMFLLVRILNRIESKLENHDGRINDNEVDIAILKDRVIKKHKDDL